MDENVIIDISQTQYEIVAVVAVEDMGWEIAEEDDFDLVWMDTGVTPEILSQLKPYQKINHFPGMKAITRKDELAKNLNAIRKLFQAEFNFYPPTFSLPRETNQLKKQFNSKRAKTFIVKPEASCQGKGIFLTRHFEEIPEKCVVQRYLHKPFLIDELKFDLRIYALVLGCDPLRIFVHDEGLVRFATEKYTPPKPDNLNDICKHLTNYAINKGNPNFIYNTSEDQENIGHKWSLTALFQYLQEKGEDAMQIKQSIYQIVIKTLIIAQPHIKHIYRTCQGNDLTSSMCFEILGFDILLDHKLKPWLLEVNHTPSFTTDTPLDRRIKQAVIKDALSLVNINPKYRLKYYEKNKNAENLIRRSYKENLEYRQYMRAKYIQKHEKIVNNHQGGFVKIYPNEYSDEYDHLIEGNQEAWRHYNGIKKITTEISTPLKHNEISNYHKQKTEQLLKNIIRKPLYQSNTALYSYLKRSTMLRPLSGQKQAPQVKPASLTSSHIRSIRLYQQFEQPVKHKKHKSLIRRSIGQFIKPKLVALNIPEQDLTRNRQLFRSIGKDVLKLT